MSRLQRLQSEMARHEIDALLVSKLEDLRYLCGYSGHAAQLVVTGHEAFLVTDYRYAELAKKEVAWAEVIIRDRMTTSLTQQLSSLFNKTRVERVGYDPRHVSDADARTYHKEIRGSGAIQWTPLRGLVDKLRYVKDESEIEAISQAARIADESFAHLRRHHLEVGVSERDLSIELEYQMRRRGAEDRAFDTIVLSGPRSSLPHGVPGERLIAEGEFVLFDFGAKVRGYRSDMTRTHLIGEPDDKQREVYELVRKAQGQALECIKAGVRSSVPHLAARAVIEESPYTRYAGEGLGHGVGLDLHERPLMGFGDDEPLLEGCVVTVEPGIYIPNWGGVRIEDDVVVTAEGYKLLTNSPRGLRHGI
jgi:Xaa-Pro aminopeptidase/Xaa-Pro dipeptidase